MKQIQTYIKHLLLSTVTILFVFFNAFSQTKSIVGTINDNNGDSLPGVTVRVQGTDNGVITNIEGKFTISALATDKLVITYIGMKQQALKTMLLQ